MLGTLRRSFRRGDTTQGLHFSPHFRRAPLWLPLLLALLSIGLLAGRAILQEKHISLSPSLRTIQESVKATQQFMSIWKENFENFIVHSQSGRQLRLGKFRARKKAVRDVIRLKRLVRTGQKIGKKEAFATNPNSTLDAIVREGPVHKHAPSRLFGHFDVDDDGLLSEKEVAALLKMLTRKNKEEAERKAKDTKRHSAGATDGRQSGTHDITIDGETLSVGDGDFDLLFKQLSNVKQTKDPSKDPRMTLQEDIVFVKDLVIVFSAATVGGVLAINFNQPALFGFLVGGMMVGPGGLAIVTELVEIETLASLGIAFLLFSIGVEFSFTEVQSVRKIAVFGGLLSMFAVVVGSGGLAVLFSLVDSLPQAVALGLALSLSSTAVVMQCLPSTGDAHSHVSAEGQRQERAANIGSPLPGNGAWVEGSISGSPQRQSLEYVSPYMSKQEAGLFGSPKSRKAMLGLLVFQDVMIGLILALLPTLKGSAGDIFEELVSSALRLGCFVVLALAIAEFVLPPLMDRLDRAGSSEVFTIGCVVFCLAAAYVSEKFGLAIELGAFAAGMMLSESRHKEKVERAISTVRDVFTAIFFISIGMMIHWRYFYQNSLKMAILVVITVVVKTLVMGAAMLAFGDLPPRTALACGATLSQAGEFTFVVASKGLSLLLFSPSQTRMILGATAITMLITPYIIKYAKASSSKSLSSETL